MLCLALVAAVGCKGAKAEVKLSKQASAVNDDVIPNVPVPAENGPRLFAVRAGAKIVDRPSPKGEELGELLLGGSVARSTEPFVKRDSCPKGYYPVRPRGFVCLDEKTSLDAAPPIAPPAVDRALPYRFGRTTSPTPVYARMPSLEEQGENEPGLEKHLAKPPKSDEAMTSGANDVPVDDHAIVSGPPVISKTAEGVGPDGKRTRAAFFEFGGGTPAPQLAERFSGPVVLMVIKKGSGVPLVGSTTAEGPMGPRHFGILPDGSLIPIDRLEPALGSTWHGAELKDVALPVGFVLKHETTPFSVSDGKATKLDDEEVERRSMVKLTNKFRMIDGVRYEEAEGGKFFRDKDLIKIVKRSKFPDFVKGDTKWVDVGLALQTMVLYEGKKPVYATLISSGQDVIGDPATSASTLQGTFKITRKTLWSSVDSKEVHDAFDVLGAPYAIEFSPGFSLRSAYWSDNAGEARSFHDVFMTPVDAHRLFAWAGPEVPQGWLSVAPKDDETIVYVRK